MNIINSNDLLRYIRKILVSFYMFRLDKNRIYRFNNTEFYSYNPTLDNNQVKFFCRLKRYNDFSNIGYRIYFNKKLILNTLFKVYKDGKHELLFHSISNSEFLYILLEVEKINN